jgi:tetratricopeptide (TPR) repeat protein
MLGTLLAESGDTAAAEAHMRALLKQPSGFLQKAGLLDSLCCLPLFHGRKDLLAEADAWSNEALSYSPKAITLKGTRGSILIELGRIDEGIAMLTEVFKRSECPIDHTISAAYLAKAYSAKGLTNESNQWLEKANVIQPENTVARRISKELLGTSYIKIVGLPPGEAPESVRNEWIGLTLPLASTPSAFLLKSGGVVTRKEEDAVKGYMVEANEAVALLEQKSPTAAQWWRTNTPHLLANGKLFIFREHVCALVQPSTHNPRTSAPL